MKIDVIGKYKDDYKTREAGEKLRKEIIHHLSKEEVILDFSDKMIASVSFLDESIAKLSQEEVSREDLLNLKIINMYEKDFQLLSKLMLAQGLIEDISKAENFRVN